MVYRLNLPIVYAQVDLMDFDEAWTVNVFGEYSNGVYIRFSRNNYYLKNRPDIVEYIGKLVQDPNWDEVLVDWSW